MVCYAIRENCLFLLRCEKFLSCIYSTARGLRESLMNSGESSNDYCNKIFGGWDFALTNTSTVEVKHKIKLFDLKVSILFCSQAIRISILTNSYRNIVIYDM